MITSSTSLPPRATTGTSIAIKESAITPTPTPHAPTPLQGCCTTVHWPRTKTSHCATDTSICACPKPRCHALSEPLSRQRPQHACRPATDPVHHTLDPQAFRPSLTSSSPPPGLRGLPPRHSHPRLSYDHCTTRYPEFAGRLCLPSRASSSSGGSGSSPRLPQHRQPAATE